MQKKHLFKALPHPPTPSPKDLERGRSRKFSKGLFILGILCILIGIGAPLLPLRGGHAQSDPPPVELNEDTIKRATVFVMQTYQEQNQMVISCVGSGTLVSVDGLILTNAHNAVPSDTCRSDQLVISMTVRLDEPPIPTYTAEIVDASQGLNLAVLRINGYLDGRAIEPGSLQLPFVELGDSDAVQLDDTITIVGYPTFGQDPVTVTRGTAQGFTAEARAGNRAWLRTGATIPGTMSGGGAYDRSGKLIGIPTIAPTIAGGELVDCRVIQDSNQDGRADRNDTCVPVGGFISTLRPAALARGLVRASALGIRQGTDLTNTAPLRTEGNPTVSTAFFTTSVNAAGQPGTVVGGGAPSGINSLYYFFDYDNMVDGMIYELRVTLDGNYEPNYSLPPSTWSGGEHGTWYIGSTDIIWRNGVYEFRLFIDGREYSEASRKIVLSGAPTNHPLFSDIVFGVLDGNGGLIGTGYVLPEGSAVQARFSFLNMEPGTTWTHAWSRDGQIIYVSNGEAWPAERGVQGTYDISVGALEGGFTAGEYRVSLYINNVLSATSSFVIAGGAASDNTANVFSDIRFTTDASSDEPGGTARTEFPAGIESLYAFFNWNLLATRTTWTRRWTVDGEVMFEVTEAWDAGPDGQNYFVSLDSLAALPDATYGLDILLGNVLVKQATVKVGLGQLPVGAFASASGVQLVGRITDAETGQGIPGAMFIVLESEYSIEDFLWDQSQVLGSSLADSEGRFQVPALLPRGTTDEPLLYSVLVRAEGYLPVNGDGIIVIDSTASPIEINVALTKN
jgi:hypothetical protein